VYAVEVSFFAKVQNVGLQNVSFDAGAYRTGVADALSKPMADVFVTIDADDGEALGAAAPAGAAGGAQATGQQWSEDARRRRLSGLVLVTTTVRATTDAALLIDSVAALAADVPRLTAATGATVVEVGSPHAVWVQLPAPSPPPPSPPLPSSPPSSPVPPAPPPLLVDIDGDGEVDVPIASGPQGILGLSSDSAAVQPAVLLAAAIIVVFVLPAAFLYLVWRRRRDRKRKSAKVDPLSGPISRRLSRSNSLSIVRGDKAKADMDVVHVVPPLSPAQPSGSDDGTAAVSTPPAAATPPATADAVGPEAVRLQLDTDRGAERPDRVGANLARTRAAATRTRAASKTAEARLRPSNGAAKAHEPQDDLALHAQQGWLAKEMSAMAEREVVTTQLDWLEHELEHQKSGSSVGNSPAQKRPSRRPSLGLSKTSTKTAAAADSLLSPAAAEHAERRQAAALASLTRAVDRVERRGWAAERAEIRARTQLQRELSGDVEPPAAPTRCSSSSSCASSNDSEFDRDPEREAGADDWELSPSRHTRKLELLRALSSTSSDGAPLPRPVPLAPSLQDRVPAPRDAASWMTQQHWLAAEMAGSSFGELGETD
jgi:hypothetical protein